MMNRTVSALLATAVLLTSIHAWADNQAPSPVPIVSPVSKGQPSPFTGVLFSPEAVAKVVAKVDGDAALAKLALQKHADDDAARLKFQVDSLTSKCTEDKRNLQAIVDDGKRQITILENQLKKNAAPKLSGGTWFGIGVASGVVVAVLTTVLISKSVK